VNGLERELRALAPLVEWPATPDLAEAVSARVAAPAPRRWRTRRLVVVLAVLLLALAVAFAVPPARTAILDWLGVGSARIELVDRLPGLEPRVQLDLLGPPTTLSEARVDAGFPFALPPRDEPAPDEVRLVVGERVSYVWRDGGRVRLLVTQVPGRPSEQRMIRKLVPPDVTVEQLVLDGRRAVWIAGGPHAVFLLEPDGSYREDRGWLAGTTLLVDRDASTLRIEGALDRDRAVALAREMTG
jgi:hypothetical protein